MFHKLYKLVVSDVCCLCDTDGHKGLDLCHACHKSLPHNHFSCFQCAAPFQYESTDHTQVCGGCLSRPSGIDHAIIPFLYRPPIDFMIKRLKFSEQLKYSRLLGDLLADAIEQHYQGAGSNPLTTENHDFPDRILPVPSHHQRLLQRGFNQAEQIAATVARRFDRHYDTTTVARTAAGQSQSSLSATQREANIRRTFEIENPAVIEGSHVAVVDDVYTTGATAKAISRKLKSAGAARISIWAVARTP